MTAIIIESNVVVSTCFTFDILYETTVSLKLNEKTEFAKSWEIEDYNIDEYEIERKYIFRLDDEFLLKHPRVKKVHKMVPFYTSTGWVGVEMDVYEHIHNDVARIKHHELKNIKLIEERNSDIKISFGNSFRIFDLCEQYFNDHQNTGKVFRDIFFVGESQRSNNAKNILDLKNHSDVYIFKFGKYKGMPMKKVCSQHGEKTVIGYIRWCLKNIKLFENDIKYFDLIDKTNKILISENKNHKALDILTCDDF